MPKDAYYFPHDSNASQDPKILQMRSVYGAEGYGWYWMIIEMMREQEDYLLPIEGKYACNAYAMRLQCDSIKLHEYINDCVSEFHLFEEKDGSIFSRSLNRRMENYTERSDKARKAAQARWHPKQEQENNANAMPTQSDSNAKRVKESKVKEKKVASKNATAEKVKEITKNSLGEPIRQVFAGIDERRGYRPPKRNAEAASIMRMLKMGYSPDDILKVWDQIKSESFYHDKELYLMTVESQIGAKLNGNGHKQSKGNPLWD